MMEAAEEERTGTMEGNRDVEMGIDGEGVGVGGEREQRRLERKGGFVEQNIQGDVNTTRGGMQILIIFMRNQIT